MKLLKVMHAKFACQFTDGEHMEDESSSSVSQLFNGFQTITTLEKDVFVTDLATPNFSTYFKSTSKNETGTTEDEMKKMTRAVKYENEAIGNATILIKDRRTSLWELFQKTKTVEKKNEPVMKKILKRRLIQPSSKDYTVAPVGTINLANSADEKLHKILRILQRVHPEALAISQKSQNLWKYVMKSNCTNEGCRNKNQMLSEDIIIFPFRAISEKSENHTKSNMSNHLIYGGGDTNWKTECWIKSDAEYLILEL
ncbi:unnamed protein product [Lactuca virosa]|uniref:Uncharacterized protein n=1 Tax=Lactuca virosa TaxID=75947 RepID=A0AAU9M5Q3_9ASTR|nr:unnamed protein product [Lactuca virosa]